MSDDERPWEGPMVPYDPDARFVEVLWTRLRTFVQSMRPRPEPVDGLGPVETALQPRLDLDRPVIGELRSRLVILQKHIHAAQLEIKSLEAALNAVN